MFIHTLRFHRKWVWVLFTERLRPDRRRAHFYWKWAVDSIKKMLWHRMRKHFQFHFSPSTGCVESTEWRILLGVHEQYISCILCMLAPWRAHFSYHHHHDSDDTSSCQRNPRMQHLRSRSQCSEGKRRRKLKISPGKVAFHFSKYPRWVCCAVASERAQLKMWIRWKSHKYLCKL